jgi:hypothetical protein
MSNLVCKNCKSVAVEYEDYCGGTSYFRCKTCGMRGNKDKFTQVTVFDHITASPEVLAEKFIGLIFDHRFTSKYRYYSMLTGEFYNSREEAHAATVAKLKEVTE